MPSKKYAAPLSLEPRRSARLQALFFLSVAGALLLPRMVTMPPWMLPLLWAMVAFVAASGWRRHFGRQRIIAAHWDEAGGWRLAFADGGECEAALEGESFVTPEVLVLVWTTPLGPRHLVVLPDVLDADTRRRLRVRLRLEGGRKVQDDLSRPL